MTSPCKCPLLYILNSNHLFRKLFEALAIKILTHTQCNQSHKYRIAGQTSKLLGKSRMLYCFYLSQSRRSNVQSLFWFMQQSILQRLFCDLALRNEDFSLLSLAVRNSEQCFDFMDLDMPFI